VTSPFSVYLDLVRFIAAVLVYLYHSNQRWLVTSHLPASNFGHSAVIVFFVLSGFVIAFVTDSKERTWTSYAASRLSRIYSVVIPAVALTLVLDAFGRQLAPQTYGYPFDHLALRTASSVALLNEWWFVSITSFSNVPFWSVCYESWYYVAFGLLTFLPRPYGYVALVALALLLGPKIVLLAPVWWAGVALYHWRALERLSTAWAVSMVGGSIVGIFYFHHWEIMDITANAMKEWLGKDRHAEYTFSKFFLSDYLLCILVFLNFVGMRRIAPSIRGVLLPLKRPIRYVAGFTFTLYLLHHPLFLFWGSVVGGDPGGLAYWTTVTFLTFLSVILVGSVTESRRYLLKAWLERNLTRLKRSPKAGGQHATDG
jgi:peptidoglycan/LPS O-acetylase OafA/YrhL